MWPVPSRIEDKPLLQKIHGVRVFGENERRPAFILEPSQFFGKTVPLVSMPGSSLISDNRNSTCCNSWAATTGSSGKQTKSSHLRQCPQLLPDLANRGFRLRDRDPRTFSITWRSPSFLLRRLFSRAKRELYIAFGRLSYEPCPASPSPAPGTCCLYSL